MRDLIKRQAAIDALKERFNYEERINTEYGAYWHHRRVLEALECLPSAQTEIIRCKYCGCYESSEDDEVGWCYVWDNTTEENAFCSHAKGKGEQP